MLSVFIIAISLSIDALGVGVAYGIRKIKIPLLSKLFICLFSIIYSGIAIFLGDSLSGFLSPAVSKLIGVMILLMMGVWITLQAVFRKDDPTPSNSSPYSKKTLFEIAIKSLGITIQVIKNPMKGDIDRSGVIDVRESLLLGLALSVDAIGAGIGIALAGFSSMVIPLAVGLCQFILLYAGTYLGEKFYLSEKINKKAISLIPGILLIFLAVIRIY